QRTGVRTSAEQRRQQEAVYRTTRTLTGTRPNEPASERPQGRGDEKGRCTGRRGRLGGARRDGGALGGAGAVSALGARNKEPGGACAGGWGLKRSRTTEGPAWDGGAFGRLGEGADQMVASASAGQLILIWTPLGVEAIST